MPPRIPCNKLGDYLTDAVASQQELGWDNFLKGRITSAWGETQAVHLRTFYPTSTQHTRLQWKKSLVVLIWNCFYH
eukprot:458112-Ditylum_brightwellii.AAC.1